MFQKKPKPPKKTLDDLLNDKSVITGKDVLKQIKDEEQRQKEFQESVEFEVMNRRRNK
jgi:hypothetical protein